MVRQVRQPRQTVRTRAWLRTTTGTAGADPASRSRSTVRASASGSAAGAPARTRQPLAARRAARTRSPGPSRVSISTKSDPAARRLSGNGQSGTASASHVRSTFEAGRRAPIRPPLRPRATRAAAISSSVVLRPDVGAPDTSMMPARRSRLSRAISSTAGESPMSERVEGGPTATTPASRRRYSWRRTAGRTLSSTRGGFWRPVVTTPRGAFWNTAARKPSASLGAIGKGCSSPWAVRSEALSPSRPGCRLSSTCSPETRRDRAGASRSGRDTTWGQVPASGGGPSSAARISSSLAGIGTTPTCVPQ